MAGKRHYTKHVFSNNLPNTKKKYPFLANGLNGQSPVNTNVPRLNV
jgi:hypothetical protein